MALGEFKMFQFKSKKQRDKEAKEYAAWAFPYGDLQRERLMVLVRELMPKGPVELKTASFLTCKELYDDVLENSESREEATDKMINSLRSYGQLISANEMPFYLALVLADSEIDENCNYPSANEMRERIQKLTDMRTKTKLSLFKKKKNDTEKNDTETNDTDTSPP